MFTGLVQAIGTVRTAEPDGHGGRRFRVVEPTLAPRLAVGESVAISGACMTVTATDDDSFAFEAGPESLARTILGRLHPGDRVNLERAMRAGDLFGGHFVSGHVDTVGTIAAIVPSGDWRTVWFQFPAEFRELLVEKGSVAVDGVSLTVAADDTERFSVMLIPHTLAVTTLGLRKPGDPVNLEFDLLAKHVRKLVRTLPTQFDP